GVGMLSAGLLGGPGIGYKQDYFATEELQTKDNAAYERYRSPDTNGFLFFPAIRGLDGSKVAILDAYTKAREEIKSGAKTDMPKLQIENDIDLLRKADKVYSEKEITDLVAAKKPLNGDQSLWQLYYWWEANKKYAAEDAKPVNNAVLHGGRMALIYTAAVPALMAIGYLFLILYFRSKGGYTAEVLVGHKAHDEEFTGGVEGPAEM
ncbi:MAG: hypothetical protein AB7K24_03425, partial [Gemmataceae bacterium]